MASYLVRLWVTLLLGTAVAAAMQPTSAHRHLLIVVDGLRPDYVTEAVMPHLTALGQRGVVFSRHHSVYPTVTRVNAASFSTGAYPAAHGLLGNSVFFPGVDKTRFLDTADRDQLVMIMNAERELLTAPTLGERLQAAGRKMLVVSSGSAGSALLNNHLVAGGAILHPQFTLPESLASAVQETVPALAASAPSAARDARAVDMFLKVGLPRVDPSVTVLWLGGLDATAHEKGIGAPETIAVLRGVDVQIKRVEDGLRSAGVVDSYNIWVTSDHGFSTYTGGADVGAVLKPFQGVLADGSPRLVSSGGAVYVRDKDPSAVAGIVAALQRTPGVGAIFTNSAVPGSFDGRVAGTLSFDAIRWDHPRSADILFSPDWSDAANVHGVRGSAASGGTAGHGSSSPWDIHNTAIAAGPDIKRGVRIDAPSANVDFAPTFLKTLGLPVPATVQGRPLEEALINGGAGVSAVRTFEHVARTPDGRYAVAGNFSIVTAAGREHRYFDGTRVVRK
jgi:predicted AlkP superfamily pyrophosphatase or phosphodiesterase